MDRLEQLALVLSRQHVLPQFFVLVDKPARLDYVGGRYVITLVQFHVDDKVVDVLLCTGELQPSGQHGHHQGRAARSKDASEDGDATTTVRVGDDVTVAHGEEGDGDQPHGVKEVTMDEVMIHLAGPDHPAGHHEHRYHEHGEHVLRVEHHHGLEDELEVEVDAVERSETLRGGVREQPAVEHDNTTDEEQPQEHRDGEDDINGH